MPKTPKFGVSPEKISFMRGGVEVSLYKSPSLISAQLRDGTVLENLPGRLFAELQLPPTVRFVRRFPGRRVAVLYCRKADRDAVMEKLRAQKEVQYCSHVLRRLPAEDMPGAEIGLDNVFFVDFGRRPTAKQVEDIESTHRVRAIWRFLEMPGGVVFQLTAEAKENPIKIAGKLMKTKKYKTVEPCLIEAKAGRAIPHDAGFTWQWHLLNTGQGGGVSGADCNAVAAWDYTWGDPNIKIALIDDGFDLSHPDLGGDGKVRAPYDATQRDTDPSPETFGENHGTSCAGVAVASRGSGICVGVAPDCTWMPIRHAGRIGDFEEALAFYHAYKNGADVISCSWGPFDAYVNEFWPMPSLTRYVIDICAILGRRRKGIPIFFAAGNGNEALELDGYANYKNVIAVAACTNEDKKAPYSDYGSNVWVTAPSSGGTLGILTTDRTGPAGYSWQSDYTAEFGGTSAATPLVAGVAALMLSVNPKLTLAQLRDILRKTAVRINRNQPREYTDYWGNRYNDKYDNKGHSKVYGWGRVDAGAAVAAAKATH